MTIQIEFTKAENSEWSESRPFPFWRMGDDILKRYIELQLAIGCLLVVSAYCVIACFDFNPSSTNNTSIYHQTKDEGDIGFVGDECSIFDSRNRDSTLQDSCRIGEYICEQLL